MIKDFKYHIKLERGHFIGIKAMILPAWGFVEVCMQPSEREKRYLQQGKNKEIWIKTLAKNKSKKFKEGIGMADSDEMEKKFF